MKKKKKSRIGNVQGHALLYGRSSRAIRIVSGEQVGKVEKQHRPPKKKNVVVKPSQKKYKMSEEAKRILDNLRDPLDIMSRNARTQKYEAVKSREDFEYGLSDW